MKRNPQKLEYAPRHSPSLPRWAQWLIVLAIASVLILFVLYLIQFSIAR